MTKRGVRNGILVKLVYIKMNYRYPIYGGMQDWNYIHEGCFELTLEISDVKWPNAIEVSSQISKSRNVIAFSVQFHYLQSLLT